MAVAAVILAAGQGTRFQAAAGNAGSKLLADLHGRPLVRYVAEAAVASGAAPVIAVTGYSASTVQAALAGLPIGFVHNPRFAQGLSTSLRIGIGAMPAGVRGALVLLGDMPLIAVGTLAALMRRAEVATDADAVVAIHDGQRGNPVLLGRSLFVDVQGLAGDEGARRLLTRPGTRIEEVEVPSQAVLADVDLPGDLNRLAPEASQAR